MTARYASLRQLPLPTFSPLISAKGLVYFTDGYGIYPESPPRYDTLFVFDREDEYRMPVPGWAIKVILEDEE